MRDVSNLNTEEAFISITVDEFISCLKEAPIESASYFLYNTLWSLDTSSRHAVLICMQTAINSKKWAPK